MSLTKASFSMIEGAPFNVLDYGADPTGVADSAAAIQAAISDATIAVGSSTGATVYFPTGTYAISTTINIPNRVSLVGNGDYAGVTIKPLSGFSSNYMLYASNGTTSMFGSYVKNMYIDARGFNMIAPVHSIAWQEACGLVNVLIQFDGLTPYGFLYSTGYGGAAYLRLQETQIFADSTASNAAGILVTQVSSVGGFVLDFQNGTIAGSVANPLPSGIRMENDSLRVQTYHCELVTNMVVMAGAGSLSADTLTGSFDGPVDNMVRISSTFTGAVSLRNMIPNGTLDTIFSDGVSGRDISSDVGMLPSYDYQPSAFSASVSAQIPNVTGNGTEYPIVFNNQIYDYLGEYNPATGVFTAQRTGKYVFSTCVKITVATAVTTYLVKISTSNREYIVFRGDTDAIRDASGTLTLNGSIIADMDAGDTASVRITVTGLGADTVDVEADETLFEGQYLSR